MNLDASIVHCFVKNVSFFVNVSLLEILTGHAVFLHSSPSTKELSVRLKLVSKYRYIVYEQQSTDMYQSI